MVLVHTHQKKQTLPSWQQQQQLYIITIKEAQVVQQWDHLGYLCLRGWCIRHHYHCHIIHWQHHIILYHLIILRKMVLLMIQKLPLRAKSSGKNFTNSVRRWSSPKVAGKKLLFLFFYCYIFFVLFICAFFFFFFNNYSFNIVNFKLLNFILFLRLLAAFIYISILNWDIIIHSYENYIYIIKIVKFLLIHLNSSILSWVLHVVYILVCHFSTNFIYFYIFFL